jgi:hypothetical protein
MTIEVTERQFHTILAGLRCWQRYLAEHPIYVDDDIASNCGEVQPLTQDEIDDLCERLNCGGALHDDLLDLAKALIALVEEAPERQYVRDPALMALVDEARALVTKLEDW